MGDLMRRWAVMIGAQPRPSYEGIPIYLNNKYFQNSDLAYAKLNNTVASDDFFIAGPFDTGSEGEKTFTCTVTPVWPNSKSFVARLFNTLEGNPVATALFALSYSGNARSYTAAGRYILIPVYKQSAANAFAYYTENGVTHYLFKGSNVT